MKMIKSLLLITAGVCVTTLLHAQEKELKTATAKPVAVTAPPPGTKPAMAATIQPDSKIKPSGIPGEPVTATASPLKRDTDIKAPQEKPTVKLSDGNENTTQSLSADNMKTLNGTAERSRQTVPLTNNQNAKPLPISKPAVLNTQGNQ